MVPICALITQFCLHVSIIFLLVAGGVSGPSLTIGVMTLMPLVITILILIKTMQSTSVMWTRVRLGNSIKSFTKARWVVEVVFVATAGQWMSPIWEIGDG
jgi:hypothetical protein